MSTVPINSLKYFCFILNYRNYIQTHKFLSQYTSVSVGEIREKIENTANRTANVVYVLIYMYTYTHARSIKFWLAILQEIYHEILFISRYTLVQTNM